MDKFLFARQDRVKVYTFGLVSTLCVLLGNMFFLWHVPGVWPYGVFVAATAFYLGLTYLVGFKGKDFDLDEHNYLVSKWYEDVKKASIDVFLPICGEDEEIIINTWSKVAQMAPHYPNMKVFVLDDKPTKRMEFLATKNNFEYITRTSNELKKAGNLRNAFAQTNGDYILILDADFAPERDFPIEALPYMLEDSKVAIVQTPQFFSCKRNRNWLENAAGAVQELFYRLIQVNRDTFGGAICVGTNAMYRRDALAPFGGTAPMAYSEDVHTGFQCLISGWKIKYVPVIVAEGRCPDSMKQFFTQQYRWSMGSISLFFSDKFWEAKITRMQRICYLTGMFFYITTGLGVFFIPLPSILMLSFFPDKVHWYNLLFSVPSLLFGTLFMMYWMKLPMNLDVLRVRQISYYAHFYALRDFLTGSLEEWKPTGVKSNSQRYDAFCRLFTIWNFLTVMATAMLITVRVAEGYNPVSFILIAAFTILHAIIVWPVIERAE